MQGRTDLLMRHNQPVYEKVAKAMSENQSVLLQAATGTGKSYIAAAYMLDHPGRWLVVTPKNAVEDMWNGKGKKYGLNLKTVTYQALSLKTEKEVQELSEPYVGFVLDEAHHVAAAAWSRAIAVIMGTGKPVLGLSANSMRYSDGVDVSETYFHSCVHGYSLGEGIGAGILPSFQYVTAMFSVPKFRVSKKLPKEKRKEYAKLLSRLEYSIENKNAIEDILQKHLERDKCYKIIVFVENLQDLPQAKKCLEGLVDSNNIFTMSHLKGKKQNREALDMFTKCEESAAVINVNILTEGIHADGANVLIMLRRTASPSVFFQQLGRIVSATGKGDLYAFDFVGNYMSLKTNSDVQLILAQGILPL